MDALLEAVEVFLPVELFAVVAEEVLKELFDDVEGTAAGEAVEAVAAAEVAAAAAAVAAVDSEAVLAVADPAPPALKDPKNERYALKRDPLIDPKSQRLLHHGLLSRQLSNCF